MISAIINVHLRSTIKNENRKKWLILQGIFSPEHRCTVVGNPRGGDPWVARKSRGSFFLVLYIYILFFFCYDQVFEVLHPCVLFEEQIVIMASGGFKLNRLCFYG
jgi:hypothetical protein